MDIITINNVCKNYKTKKAILNLLEEITNSVSNDKIVELLNSLKK